MAENLKMLKQGAEAKLFICKYLGRPTLIKERFQKHYRHPELDKTITKERIKQEARSIAKCKTIGVKTPALYLVDFERRRIYMEHFEQSITVKDFIIMTNPSEETLSNLTKTIGETIRKLHDNHIIHGDLTTSNMLIVYKNDSINNINDFELAFIDFGLSVISQSAEDKGVDLYVLERALMSTHNDIPSLFGRIFDCYQKFNKKNVNEIINKYEEVRARGRKRTMVG